MVEIIFRIQFALNLTWTWNKLSKKTKKIRIQNYFKEWNTKKNTERKFKNINTNKI